MRLLNLNLLFALTISLPLALALSEGPLKLRHPSKRHPEEPPTYPRKFDSILKPDPTDTAILQRAPRDAQLSCLSNLKMFDPEDIRITCSDYTGNDPIKPRTCTVNVGYFPNSMYRFIQACDTGKLYYGDQAVIGKGFFMAFLFHPFNANYPDSLPEAIGACLIPTAPLQSTFHYACAQADTFPNDKPATFHLAGDTTISGISCSLNYKTYSPEETKATWTQKCNEAGGFASYNDQAHAPSTKHRGGGGGGGWHEHSSLTSHFLFIDWFKRDLVNRKGREHLPTRELATNAHTESRRSIPDDAAFGRSKLTSVSSLERPQRRSAGGSNKRRRATFEVELADASGDFVGACVNKATSFDLSTQPTHPPRSFSCKASGGNLQQCQTQQGQAASALLHFYEECVKDGEFKFMGNSAPENYVLLTFSTPPTGKTDTDTTKAECFLKDPKISANLYKEVSCSKPYVFARGLHDTSVAEQDCEVAERVGIDGLINLAREICLEGKGFLSVVQKALPFSSLYVTDFDHGHCFSPEKIDIRKAGSTFGCFDGGEPKLIAEGETKTSFVTTCYADTEFDKGKALTMLFQQCKKGTFLVDADVLGQDDWKEPNGVQELLRPPSYYINIKYGHVESGRFNEMRSCYFSQKDNADLGSRADAIVCCKAGDPGNPSECKDVVSELEPEYSNLTGKLETRVCILIRSWMSTGLQNSIADHCRRSGGFLADSIQKRHERPKHRVKRSPRHFPSHHFQPICHHNPHCSEGKDDQHRP